MPWLETEHLIQRPWTLDAIDTVLERGPMALSALWQIAVSDAFPQADYAEALPSIRRGMAEDPAAADLGGVVIHRADRIVIGAAGFRATPTDEGALELGYDIVPAYRNRGHATEIAAALLAWALERPDVRAVTAGCKESNPASRRVIEKIGMKPMGRRGSLLLWRAERMPGA